MEEEKKRKHYISLELTSVEWEVVKEALEAPIRLNLIAGITALYPGITQDEIEAAWNSVITKWAATW